MKPYNNCFFVCVSLDRGTFQRNASGEFATKEERPGTQLWQQILGVLSAQSRLRAVPSYLRPTTHSIGRHFAHCARSLFLLRKVLP